jgi:hypothetical protein
MAQLSSASAWAHRSTGPTSVGFSWAHRSTGPASVGYSHYRWKLSPVTSVGSDHHSRWKLTLTTHNCLVYFVSLHMWQHKKHIISTCIKFIITYTILPFTLSHNSHNMRIHMSNTHSHCRSTLSHTHTHRSHSYCLILIHIEVIHIVSYSHTYKTWNWTHCLIHTHKSYEELHISRRREIVRVVFTTVRSVVEKPWDK